MELTAKEQKRMKRLERVARQGKFVVYPLAAGFLALLGMTLHAFLTDRKEWIPLGMVSSSSLYLCLMYLRDTQFLVRITKKLQNKDRDRRGY